MSKRHISRGIDYLNDLGAKLRDLTGFMTLAHELIQNADDAPRATEMAFDVCGDALVVDNNGVFSDCGNAEGPVASCALKAKEDYMCDFHRFRLVASGDKRGQEGMTGEDGWIPERQLPATNRLDDEALPGVVLQNQVGDEVVLRKGHP